MKEVTINKSEALAKLRENRAAHKAIFDEAVEGFRKQAAKLLREEIKRVASGKIEQVYVLLPRPVDHTRDYDRVISMLEMSVNDEVVISQNDFASYIMDDWGWKREFLETNSSYSVRAASALGG